MWSLGLCKPPGLAKRVAHRSELFSHLACVFEQLKGPADSQLFTLYMLALQKVIRIALTKVFVGQEPV